MTTVEYLQSLASHEQYSISTNCSIHFENCSDIRYLFTSPSRLNTTPSFRSACLLFDAPADWMRPSRRTDWSSSRDLTLRARRLGRAAFLDRTAGIHQRSERGQFSAMASNCCPCARLVRWGYTAAVTHDFASSFTLFPQIIVSSGRTAASRFSLIHLPASFTKSSRNDLRHCTQVWTNCDDQLNIPT